MNARKKQSPSESDASQQPDESPKTLHYLQILQMMADETHPGLGKLLAASVLFVKAKRTLLLVAPAGCGKSQVTENLGRYIDDALLIDAATEAGLTPLQDRLTNFNGIVILDDLGRLNSGYRRLATMSTLSELAYSHYAEAHTGHQHLSITGFYGSVVMGCQPVVLGPVIQTHTWDATLQDKTLRYYHLIRPTKGNTKRLDIPLNWGYDLDGVSMPDLDNPAYQEIMDIAIVQWSPGRIYEHVESIVRAAAALDDSHEVRGRDIAVATELMRPMKMEQYTIDRKGLEGDKQIRNDFLLLLIEFATHGTLTLANLERDFKVSPATAYKVMNQYKRMWVMTSKKPSVYAPSEALLKIMKEVI